MNKQTHFNPEIYLDTVEQLEKGIGILTQKDCKEIEEYIITIIGKRIHKNNRENNPPLS